MRMTRANLVDGLAAAAVLAMGEGGEQTPFAIMKGVPSIEFINTTYRPSGKHESFEVPIEQDIFRPLFETKVWKTRK